MDHINKLRIKVEEKTQVFEISGELVYGSTQGVKDELLNEVNNEVNDYVFDLSSMSNIDSTGMGVFITFLKHINNPRKEIEIIIADSFIYELFQIAKLDKIFRLSFKQ